MNQNFKARMRNLDLGGLECRVEKREAEEKQQAKPTMEERLANDPLLAHFVLKNRSPWSC